MLCNGGALLVFALASLSISNAQQQHARGLIPPDLLPDTSLYHLVPQGVILLWSGPAHLVPNGWAVCDGKQGTPDLRDRFVIGSGPNAQVSAGQKGGASNVTPIVTVRPTRLTVSQMPEHSHGGTTSSEDADAVCSTQLSKAGVANQENTVEHLGKADTSAVVASDTVSCRHHHTIEPQGNNEAHSHEATASSMNISPPFHALIYIMKL